jgi:hypothetical protein
MKRSYRALLTLVGMTGLLILAWLYSTGELSKRTYRIGDVSKPVDIVLRAPDAGGGIYAIELEFRGEISRDVVFEIGFPDNPKFARKLLKPGKVEAAFKSDWYYDACWIKYLPEEGTSGRLKIKYRFLSF